MSDGNNIAMVLLSGNDLQELGNKMNDLANQLRSGLDPNQAEQDCLRQQSLHLKSGYRVALLGKSSTILLREINAARKGISYCFQRDTEWNSPNGSYFTKVPLAPKGTVCLVYPGGFNAFVGIGRQLFKVASQKLETFSLDARLTDDNWDSFFKNPKLFPPNQDQLSKDEFRSLQAQLFLEPITLFEAGIRFSELTTRILCDGFRLQPSAATGYSLGEVSMLAAWNVWQGSDALIHRLQASRLYQDRLVGEMHIIRDAWPTEDKPYKERESTRWACYLLKIPREVAVQAVETEPKVFIMLVNTPNEVVIGGQPDACLRIINQTKADAMRLPFNIVMHNKLLFSNYDDLVRIHTFPPHNQPNLNFYSALNPQPLKLTTEAIAHGVAEMCCQSIDFPQLIERIYSNEVRVFVETGPRNTCTRWINEILNNRPHLAVSLHQKGMDEMEGILRAIAKLYCHQVDLDFSWLSAL